MTQEEKWFEYYTWNSLRDTEILILKAINGKTAHAIQKPVEEYLESLGFRKDTSRTEVARDSIGGWVLDLVGKKYKTEHKGTLMNMMVNSKIETAYPSQIKEHMLRYFPTLTGKRFGL